MNTIYCSSIKINLNSEFALLIFSDDNSTPEENFLELSSQLEPNLTSLKSLKGNSIVLDANAHDKGLNYIQLYETFQYHIILEKSNKEEMNILISGISTSLQDSIKNTNWKIRKIHNTIYGSFRVINYLGSFFIKINSLNFLFSFDIVSSKIEYETEYRAMTESISDFCRQLVLDYTSPSSLSFSILPEEQKKLLLEQYILIRGKLNTEQLIYILEMIKRNPHRTLEVEEELKDLYYGVDQSFLQDPIHNSKNWYQVKNKNYQSIKGYLPEKTKVIRKYDSLDTPPNRFVKYVLELILSILESILDIYKEYHTIYIEAKELKNYIDSFLESSFFYSVNNLQFIPINNQTLLKREGYKQILEIWSLLESSIKLEWNGQKDLFKGPNRNVATLYEYWLYIKIYSILKSKLDLIEITEDFENKFWKINDTFMSLSLKQGDTSLSIFKKQKEGYSIRIHFYYNKSFQYLNNPFYGSYSKPFRPDYSLVIFLESTTNTNYQLQEENAIQQGNISYIHFDAKYRIEELEHLFGIDELEGNYKKEDIYKMHTYNDAIRKTAGSYILYPGRSNKEDKFQKYHEVLPGVGAFVMRPSFENGYCVASGEDNLVGFISSIIEHQSNQYSQFYRMNYWIHDTVKRDIVLHSSNNFLYDLQTPPLDTYIMFGFIRDEEIESIKKNLVFYFYAIQNGDVVYQSNHLYQSQIFIGFNSHHKTLGWYSKIKKIQLVNKDKVSKYKNQTSNDTKDVSHYYLVDLESIVECQVYTLPFLIPGKPIIKKLNEI